MNSLDKIIKRERKRRYKRLRKLRRARDMSVGYRKEIITLSKVDKYVGYGQHEEVTTGTLANIILKYKDTILGARIRPPKPPSQKK
jgi:hypothetical protein